MAAAAQNCTASVRVTFSVNENAPPNNAPGSSGSQSSSAQGLTYNWSNGAGGTAGNVDQYFFEEYTLAAGATMNVNLQALTDGYGRAISFARVLAIAVYGVTGTADSKLELYQYATTDPWVGGPFAATAPGNIATVNSAYVSSFSPTEVAGYPVTASSNTFVINNTSAAATTFTLAIIGTFE